MGSRKYYQYPVKWKMGEGILSQLHVLTNCAVLGFFELLKPITITKELVIFIPHKTQVLWG